MSYLVPNDLSRVIQDVSLSQIISGNSLLTYQAELAAITDARSYLVAKYNVDAEFTDSTVYNPATIYHAQDRVYLDAPTYIDTATYILNSLTLYAGNVYYCTTAIIAPEAFNVNHWTLLGPQYTIFFTQYPFPLFDLKKCYKIGDQVFWNGHIYTCKSPSQFVGQEEAIQYSNVTALPYPNYFPDDPKWGSSQWIDNGAYNIPAGSLLVQSEAPVFMFFQSRVDLFITGGITTGFAAGQPTYTAPNDSLKGWTYSLELIDQGTLTPGVDYTVDATTGNPTFNRNVNQDEKFVLHFDPVVSETQTQPLPSSQTLSQLIATYFTRGDNRNQQLVLIILDIMIYNLYGRIPPGTVPEIRVFRYEKAIRWLNNVAKGDEIVADIPKLQPHQGSRTRFSSQVKQINTY